MGLFHNKTLETELVPTIHDSAALWMCKLVADKSMSISPSFQMFKTLLKKEGKPFQVTPSYQEPAYYCYPLGNNDTPMQRG